MDSFESSLSSADNSPKSTELTPKKSKRDKKSICQQHSILNSKVYQAFQILLGILYFVICLIGIFAHMSNYK